jgi:hypothetical protein
VRDVKAFPQGFIFGVPESASFPADPSEERKAVDDVCIAVGGVPTSVYGCDTQERSNTEVERCC